MTGNTHEPCTITLFTTSPQEALAQRVRGEYREMPGMRLTLDQAMRLWMLDRTTCTELLRSLVAEHFLRQDPFGRYTTVHSGY